MKESASDWFKDGAWKSKLDSQAGLDELQKRIGLDATARELLALVWASERSLAVARQARELSGSRGLTVEVARHALARPLDAALAAGAPLRRHALIVLDTAGPALAQSLLRLGAGVGARLEGAPLSLDDFAPGVRLLRDVEDRFPASAKVAEVIKDRLVSREPLLATVDGCSRKEALALGAGSAKRYARGLLTVDGELFAGLPECWELLQALRREADLEGLVMLVHQAAALGEAWRALAALPTAQTARPPLVILTDSARVREVTLVEGLRHQPMTLNAVTEDARVEARAEVKDDPYELIRQQAQRDADRAMGIWRAAPVPPPRQAAPAPEPPKVEAKVEPPKVEVEPPNVEAKVEPPKVEAKVEAPVEAPKKKRSKKAQQYFGGGEEAEAKPAPPPPAPAPEPAPAPAAAAPEAVAEGEALNPNAPYLPVPERPTPDILANIARVSKNPQQRLELLTELSQLKIPSVVQAMRDNANSRDPQIRALAEATLAGFFGPNWNRTRAIAKPVQPPVSEDKNPNRPW
jgi:hypothetical protein